MFPRRALKRTRSQRGHTLVAALIFTAASAFLIGASGKLVVSHYQRTHTDVSYAIALDYAEAGINYELQKISTAASTADQKGTSNGVNYAFHKGLYKVYVTAPDGYSAWTPGTSGIISSKGSHRGVSRSLKMSFKKSGTTGGGGGGGGDNYVIYAVNASSTFNGSAMNIVGNVGTNSTFRFTGSPGITGGVYFNGAGAGWNSCSPTGYTVSTSATALEWKTVDEIAREFYPSGTYSPNGLDYIATNNKNATAVPPITSNSITGNVTLKAGHYYVTNLNLTGSRKITFDNSAGPIYLWIGPRAGSAVAKFRGGSAAVTTTSTNSCYIFCATQGGVDVAGNETLDAVVYSYNTEGGTGPYGYIENSGNPTINGAIIAASVGLNGNIGVNYRAYDRTLLKTSTYEFDTAWTDLSPGY